MIELVLASIRGLRSKWSCSRWFDPCTTYAYTLSREFGGAKGKLSVSKDSRHSFGFPDVAASFSEIAQVSHKP